MIVDLHCHSTASDGGLSPEQLLARAVEQGVELLAITDHDTVDGYLSVQEQSPIPLVAGIELSCVWSKVTIHVLGLGIDPAHPVMAEGLEKQKVARAKRAEIIAERLEKRGFYGALAGAQALAGSSPVGRPHFARFLESQGHVSSFNQAFKKYLGAGKPGDVKAQWPAMVEAVRWVEACGGIAVLAHPLHYKMTNTKLRSLLIDFKQAGGRGLEVVNGRQQSDHTRYLARLAEQFELLASCGSDFHRPTLWSELGVMAKLPESCHPVWLELKSS